MLLKLLKTFFLLSLLHFKLEFQKNKPNTPWSAQLLDLDPDYSNELDGHLTNAVQHAPLAIPLFMLLFFPSNCFHQQLLARTVRTPHLHKPVVWILTDPNF